MNLAQDSSRWDLFVETFFSQRLIDEYSGAIAEGV